MQHRFKERLIGVTVLVMLAVILVPIVLDNSTQTDTEITVTNVPARTDSRFTSRIVPLQDDEPATTGLETSRQLTEDPKSEKSNLETAVTSEQVSTPGLTNIAKSSDSPSNASDSPSNDASLTAWVVQLGSFSSKENANILNNKLRKADFVAFVEPLKQQTSMIYRVRVGPELLRSDAQTLKERISKTMNIESIVVQYP